VVAGVRKTVLAVDDDRSMIAFLAMLVEQMGHDFVGLHTGEDCLDQIDQIKPDLLILDVNMPGMDGYETCRRVRAEHSDVAVPVLFLTGDDARNGLSDAISAGGTEYLSKPIDSEALMQRVEYWFSLL
jgi:two-component system, sensor histidine kinase and response regulator